MSILLGGYTKFRLLSEGEDKILKEVVKNMQGCNYEPLAVATQVVAGTNYKFFCNVTPIAPDAVSKPAFVTVYCNPENKYAVTDIKDLG